MVFSSVPFLFYFLPITLLGYYLLSGIGLRNLWLLLVSLVFYAWGGGSLVVMLLVSVVLNYGFGLLASKHPNPEREGWKNPWAIVAGVTNIGLLGYYKYSNFFVNEWNHFAGKAGFSGILGWESVVLPVGISFFTFHALSYVLDVARGKNLPQRNFIQYALYICFFPQLIAGPIIRYHTIAEQLNERVSTPEKSAEGVYRFCLGLFKKVVIADSVGAIAGAVFALDAESLTPLAAWLGAISYTLQIYFDFSAYSDMAIGMALLFGFRFPENFNRPYSALSITDFWRRWHITLSSWIRQYVYIPLGGSHVSNVRLYVNLITVFFLTGLWHGASWTFVVWGLYHGAWLVAERLLGERVIEASGLSEQVIRRTATLLIVMIGWVLFRANTLDQAFDFYRHMLNVTSLSLPFTVQQVLTSKNVYVMGVASFVFLLPAGWRAHTQLVANTRAGAFLRAAILFIGFPYALVLVINSTFSPFLYFQF